MSSTEPVLYVVGYTGPFGFIKPWTAVRDGMTYSQPFLTPSIIEGLRQKLGVTGIQRHRLLHRGISLQQERTQSAGWRVERKSASRPASIITRGVMIQPTLQLAFASLEDARTAVEQHVCLCRNEDVLLPFALEEMSLAGFEALQGTELVFGAGPEAFLVGFNRFESAAPMYGRLLVVPAAQEQQR